MTLVHKTPQTDGVKMMNPEQGSDHDRVWDPDEKMSNDYVFLCISCFSHKNISMLQDNVLIFKICYIFLFCFFFIFHVWTLQLEQHQNSPMS